MNAKLYKGTALRNYESYRSIANDGMTLEEAEAIFKEYYESIDFSEDFLLKNIRNSFPMPCSTLRSGQTGHAWKEKNV